jgi:peptide chain release factor 2
MLCGVIFDAPKKKAQLAAIELQMEAPDFWDKPERSQKLLQDRKRLEEVIARDSEVSGYARKCGARNRG